MPSAKNKPTFIDLFAGCGGLSEGFIQAGFVPLAHVEMDEAACFSLKTRMAFHYLKSNKKSRIYNDYLLKKINRDDLYSSVPESVINSVIHEEINDKSIEHIFKIIDRVINGHKLDLIVGGPPCQAYSLVGRARQKDGMLGDKRNWLFKYYAEFLKRYKPDHFVFENVTGLLSAKDEHGNKYIDLMKAEFDKVGYFIEETPPVICANEHGIPQNRRRVIIIGTRKGKKPFKLCLKKQELGTTISDLLGDLPCIKSGDKSHDIVKSENPCDELDKLGIKSDFPITFHKARPHKQQDLDIYKIAVKKWNCGLGRLNYNELPSSLQTHRNRTSFTDRFKVVAGNMKSSHTVVAHIAKDGHYYIHYDIKQNRSLTPREAARLQTFPDDYYFESVDGTESMTCAFKQIGNAVPVYLAKQIALNIKQEIKKTSC